MQFSDEVDLCLLDENVEANEAYENLNVRVGFSYNASRITLTVN